MKNLYIDFDGVIMDTITSSREMMLKKGIDYKDSNKAEEITSFYANLDWAKFLNETKELNDAFLCIDKIMKSNKFNASILTHCNSLNEIISKVKFIRKFNKDITVIPVPRKISKTNMVNTKEAILIDDYSGNLREWAEAGGIGVRFSTKLNGKGFHVIDKLDQILDINF